MRKFVFAALALALELAVPLSASADDRVVTNTVVIVTNFYWRSQETVYITNMVKNSHTDHYVTNYVTVTTNTYVNNYRTNVSVNVDIGEGYLLAASNEANRAEYHANTCNEKYLSTIGEANRAASAASTTWAYVLEFAGWRSDFQNSYRDAITNISEKLRWFNENMDSHVTVIDNSTNVNIAVTVISNDFRNVPYAPDAKLRVNLNNLSVMAPGGIGNVYRVSAPQLRYDDASFGTTVMEMRFDRFDLVDGVGRYWYTSDYDTGVPETGSGTTWKFEWAYWSGREWHVAVRQRSFSGGSADDGQVFEMTLNADYPLGSGQLTGVPTPYWNDLGTLFIDSDNTTNLAAVGRLCLYEEARAMAADANARSYVDGLLSGFRPVLEDITNRINRLESSGGDHIYVHNGIEYPNITVYADDLGDGKVRATPSPTTKFAAASYTLSPNNHSTSTAATSWTFVPCYVDSDSEGMRLQYVPTTTNVIKISATQRIIVPEYLYWQGGSVYCKLRTFLNGSADGKYVSGHITYPEYPNSFSTSKPFTVDSSSSWTSFTTTTLGSLDSSNSTTAGAPIWFSASPSPSVLPFINWMSTGK